MTANTDTERNRAIALGQTDWGKYGSADQHRYAQPRKSRKRCSQTLFTCVNKVTHTGMANGVALMSGCEWCVDLWVAEQEQNDDTR